MCVKLSMNKVLCLLLPSPENYLHLVSIQSPAAVTKDSSTSPPIQLNYNIITPGLQKVNTEDEMGLFTLCITPPIQQLFKHKVFQSVCSSN